MSVTVKVMMQGGFSKTDSRVCYGWLNNVPVGSRGWSGIEDSRGCESRVLHNKIQDTSGMSYASAIQTVRYILTESESCIVDLGSGFAERKKKAMALLKEVYSDLPLFSDIASVRPLLGGVDVNVKNCPADKSMMALFIARNLINDAHHIVYRKLRSGGYNVRFSLMLSQLLGDAGTYCYLYAPDENTTLNPETFGINAAVNFMNQVEPEWKQGTFAENGTGYWRGRHYKDEHVMFTNTIGCRYRYGSLDTTLCIPDDEPLFEDFQTKRIGELWFCRNNDELRLRSVAEKVERLLQARGVNCRG